METQRTILHADMDAFFAAVEALDNPALRGKPVIVGAPAERRGVVSAASYEARKFGVHSAMPMATAVRLCPHGTFVLPRHDRYSEVSRRIMTALRDFTPLMEQTSVDEAFLDMTGSESLFGPPEDMGRAVKKRIRDETGLTASVGVAPNKFLAKLASDLRKPDGLTVIPAQSAASFIAPLPVERIWGVGPKMAARLHAMGILCIGDLAACNERRLTASFGSHAAGLQALARGEDSSPVAPGHETKSVSRETTFARFVSDVEHLEGVLLELSDEVAAQLREEKLTARTVTLKVRNEEFKTQTRSITFAQATDLGDEIFGRAKAMLRDKVSLRGHEVRLIGVAASGLESAENVVSLLLPDRKEERRKLVTKAVDRIIKKFGRSAVMRGRLIGRKRRGTP